MSESPRRRSMRSLLADITTRGEILEMASAFIQATYHDTLPHTVSLGYQSPALLATCPICGRPRGAICCDPRGNGRWGRPHRSRLKAALALPPGEGPRRNDKADPLRVYRARQVAGWTTNAAGWVAPDGTGEDDWAAEGYPFPEEPGFAEWFSAFYHYEALDDDRPSPTPADAYPCQPQP